VAQISKSQTDIDKRGEERRRIWEKNRHGPSEEWRKWQEENAEAIRSWNEWVEKNGLPLAKYRQF
jgi:post-segregation antitoxin (ccd killing protein)